MKKIPLIFLVLFILLVVFIIILLIEKKDEEKYEDINEDNEDIKDNHVSFLIFLTRRELWKKIKENTDFYNRLHSADLIARKTDNVQNYVVKIEKNVSEYNRDEKEKIKRCVLLANKKLKKVKTNWFTQQDSENIVKLPWIFGCVEGKEYEDGLPHTVKDTIIVPKEFIQRLGDNELSSLFIHEKIHIYQKHNKDIIDRYNSQNRVKKLRQRHKEDLIRANPDIDDWVYEKESGEKYGAFYRSNTPQSIRDVYMGIAGKASGNQKNEHPFEEMAIKIEEITRNL